MANQKAVTKATNTNNSVIGKIAFHAFMLAIISENPVTKPDGKGSAFGRKFNPAKNNAIKAMKKIANVILNVLFYEKQRSQTKYT